MLSRAEISFLNFLRANPRSSLVGGAPRKRQRPGIDGEVEDLRHDRATNPFEVPERKRLTDQLDLRAPEDQAASRDDDDEHAPIWSPAIEKALINWSTAKRENDDDGLKRAAREAVDATAGYYRMGGVPLFAHHPLPPQLIDADLGHTRFLPGDQAVRAVDQFVNAFDGSAKPVVVRQVSDFLKRRTESEPLAGDPVLHGLLNNPNANPSDFVGRQTTASNGTGRLTLGLLANGAAGEGRNRQLGQSQFRAVQRHLPEFDPNQARATTLELRTGERLGPASNGGAAWIQASQAPVGSYPPGREPKDVNSEDSRYPWHPHWDRYNVGRSGDGREFNDWTTDEGDFEYSSDGGKTWTKVGPPSPGGKGWGGPPNRSDNPKGTIFRKTKTDLIS